MIEPVGTSAVDIACRALLGTQAVQAHQLSASASTAVYRVILTERQIHDSMIVKVYAGRTQWKAGKEHLILAERSGCSAFGIPDVVASGPIPGHDLTALVLTDLGSNTLHQTISDGTYSRRDALGLLGQILNAFHHDPGHSADRTRSPVVSHLVLDARRLRDRLPEEVNWRVQTSLDRLARPAAQRKAVSCHGDLHFGNVVLRAAYALPYLIDFEQATDAPAEYDLAQTAVTTDALTSGDLTSLMTSYLGPTSYGLLTDLIVFHTLRGWWWAARQEGRDVALWQTRLAQVLDQYVRP
ncbi:aminoglycoside phosphotransferase family protein [Sphaerisporangium sp. NPDC049002]|uniref:aminoglycoside phosphotransferase family protein n=1 Tax=Sphaerisporangium sp. NPDC049002 TaxID=3155392 RepID=UPI00340EAC27